MLKREHPSPLSSAVFARFLHLIGYHNRPFRLDVIFRYPAIFIQQVNLNPSQHIAIQFVITEIEKQRQGKKSVGSAIIIACIPSSVWGDCTTFGT